MTALAHWRRLPKGLRFVLFYTGAAILSPFLLAAATVFMILYEAVEFASELWRGFK